MANGAEPGPVTDTARELADAAHHLAGRLEDGFQGVADDLRRFGRRRPGLFLLGAGAAGFVVTRRLRANAAASTASGDGSGTAPTGGVTGYGSTSLPPTSGPSSIAGPSGLGQATRPSSAVPAAPGSVAR
jgi:hypothetical protein